MNYPDSITELENSLTTAPATEITELAQRIIDGAMTFDLKKAENLGVNFKLKGVERYTGNLVPVEHDSIKGAPWADDPDQPLEKGEEWNEGRRATNTGEEYLFDAHGKPINPYMDTGLEGRGVLGQFGPNHAVDNGIVVIDNDAAGVPTLYALGILRKFDNDAPAFAGGFAKYKRDEGGAYIFDRDAVIDTQVEELFEECISGSINLLPEYEVLLKEKFETDISRRMEARNNEPLSRDQEEEIKEQIETGLKLQQVKDKDPEFLARLRDFVAEGKECFAGPVLNDNRSTNAAWIETRLSWSVLDADKWNDIKGDNPAFEYEFVAGDDASGVVYHRLDQDLIRNAFASHGPMFAFMAVSFLLDAQDKGLDLDPNIMQQMQGMADFLETRQNPSLDLDDNSPS